MSDLDGASSAEGGDAPVSPVNADGSFAENWTEGEAYKEHADTLSRYKTLPDLTKSLMDTKKKFGKDPNTLVEIPSETSKDEVRTAWAKAHGVPESLDGYEYELSTEMATKLGPLNDKNMAAVREFAQKKNWSPTDFKDALDLYHQMQADGIDTAGISYNEQVAARNAEGKAALQKEWLGEYDDRVLRAQAVMRKYGGDDAVAEFAAESSPTMIKFLDNIASAMSEDTLRDLTSGSSSTNAGLKTQIADIRAEMDAIQKANPATFKGNIKFKDLMKRKTELYKQFQA